MSATFCELGTAEQKLQKGFLVTATDLFEQMMLWEIRGSFGPNTSNVITEITTKLKLNEASANNRYGWVHTAEENPELVFYRKDEISRRMCLVEQ